MIRGLLVVVVVALLVVATMHGVLHCSHDYSPCRPFSSVEWRPLEDATGRSVRFAGPLPRGYRHGADGLVYYRFTYSVTC